MGQNEPIRPPASGWPSSVYDEDMERPDRRNRSSWLFLLAILAAAGGGLSYLTLFRAAPVSQTPVTPPPVAPATATQPAESAPASEPTPAESQPDSQPDSAAASQPQSAPASDESEKPEPLKPPAFVTRFEAGTATATPQIESQISAPGTVTLRTANVRRLTLTRSALPFEARGSVALRVDDQGIEWTRRSAVLELERRSSGEWVVIKPATSQP